MDRDYKLIPEWRVQVDGVDVGRVTYGPDGYQAQPESGEALYPHLKASEQHGVWHVDPYGAADELTKRARESGQLDTVNLYRGTLEVAS